MGKREEKANQTKTKIVEAARTLVREKGLENVSVDDITKLAGVAKGSFYVYYKKKEDIISDIGCLEFRYINEELEKMSNLDIISKLDYYFKRYKEGVFSLGVLITKSWLQNNLNCRCKLEYDYNTISNIINDAIKNNELKKDTDVDSLTYRIITILYGLMLIWIMNGGNIDINDKRIDVDVYNLLFPFMEVKDERI